MNGQAAVFSSPAVSGGAEIVLGTGGQLRERAAPVAAGDGLEPDHGGESVWRGAWGCSGVEEDVGVIRRKGLEGGGEWPEFSAGSSGGKGGG